MGEPVEPVESPAWDTTQANYVAPDGSHVNNGVAFNEIPPSNVFNGWMNIVYRFVNWLTAGALIIPGGQAPTGVAIVSNGITPTAGVHFVTAGGTVNLISTANHNAGRLLRLHGTTGQTLVLGNLTGSSAGFAQMQTADGDSMTLLTEQDIVEFRLNAAGNLWRECFRSASISGGGLGNTQRFDARLTAVTGTPMPTTDQLAVTTLYLTAYKGNSIGLYDGVSWQNTQLGADVSLAVPASTTKMYDVFAYLLAGVLTLEAVAWTNDTTRATALVKQNGVYVKSGATGHRYVGSFRTTGSSGKTEDSAANRFLWNYYHRVQRFLNCTMPGASWNYTTGAWRQANASSAYQLNFVVGVVEDVVKADLTAIHYASSSTAIGYVGIGINSTTVPNAVAYDATASTGPIRQISSMVSGMPIAGYNYVAWLEYGTANAAFEDSGGSSPVIPAILEGVIAA